MYQHPQGGLFSTLNVASDSKPLYYNRVRILFVNFENENFMYNFVKQI